MIAWPIHLDNAGWEAHFAHLFLSLKFYAVLALCLFYAKWLAQAAKNQGRHWFLARFLQ